MKKIIILLVICFWAVIYVAAQKVGDKVQILSGGKWYKSTILEVGNNGKYKIHYDGWASSWDEWVGPDRMKTTNVSSGNNNSGKTSSDNSNSGYKTGDKVQVLWSGTWYKSTILEAGNNGKYKIHYDGWEAKWDEWVGPERIKK